MVRAGYDAGHMAHLAARPRVRLAVKMQARAGLTKDFCPGTDIPADQIFHFDVSAGFRAVAAGGSEGPSGDRAYMLLELRGGGAVERPVTGIMDARGDFVDAKFQASIASAAGHEHFDRDDATIDEGVGNHPREPDCLSRYLGAQARRNAGRFENMILMIVFTDVIGREFAACPARGDHRDLLGEGHDGFKDRGRAAERAECHAEMGTFADQDLALAVIAETATLEDRRAAAVG